ncbi:MAG TPA: hypothetical protein V6D08_19070 [Candidatus Obscuribacterales bacterium]
MELTGWYAILGTAAVLIAVLMRFSVYTMLVKFNRWLPEKATRVANLVSGITVGIALAAIVVKAIFFSH